MNENEFLLDAFPEEAEREFRQTEINVTAVRNALTARLGDNTRLDFILDILLSCLWLSAFELALIYVSRYIEKRFVIISCAVIFLLIALMIFEALTNYYYHGKFIHGKNDADKLLERIKAGREAMDSDTETFKNAQSSGWDMPLSCADSINEASAGIEKKLFSLKKLLEFGAFQAVKFALLEAFSVIATLIGGYCLFDIAAEMYGGMFYGLWGFLPRIMPIICVAALVTDLLAQVFCSYIAWRLTAYRVDNRTLIALTAGSAAYLTVVPSLIVIGVAAVVVLAAAIAVFSVLLILHIIRSIFDR